MKKLALILLGVSLAITSFAGDKNPPTTTPKAATKISTADHLQNVSVTIRAESGYSAGEGSGVIFTRKDKDGNSVNLVWTAGHVIDNLRSERKILINGAPRTLVEFKDPMIIKEIRQNGRTVGRLQMDAEVLKYSDADDGHDLALLRIRKLNFVTDSVTFYLDEKIPALGEDLLHVGSLLGQMGANSMTDGIYSQHGRIIKDLNKHVFDQTTCTAFPGSSGGGVYLKSDARYVGMLVRGAGEGFNLIVPVRRIHDYCKRHKIMWALNREEEMPDKETLKKMPVESTPREEDNAKDEEKKEAAKKMFPFQLRIINLKSPQELKVRIKN